MSHLCLEPGLLGSIITPFSLRTMDPPGVFQEPTNRFLIATSSATTDAGSNDKVTKNAINIVVTVVVIGDEFAENLACSSMQFSRQSTVPMTSVPSCFISVNRSAYAK